MKPLLPVLLLAVLCGGCETVVFQAPPVAAQPCDAALVGNWLSVGDRKDNAGEVELRIAADCTLLFVEHEKGAPREGEPTPLHVGRDGNIAYAWVDARWAEKRMALHTDLAKPDEPSAFPEGDIALMRYRVSGRRLELRQADPKAFANRIVDGELMGVVHSQSDELAVRVTAPVDPKALRDGRLFPRGEMRFTRAIANE
jgi:hypothetical protein